ncbi:MAG: alpha/beta hydrolase-fold protein [Sphingomicrobium sp.]
MRFLAGLCALLVASLCTAPAIARVEKINVHGVSLERNLERNSADRTVFVLLPPSYDSAPARRFPVVYFLHGYTATAEGALGKGDFERRLNAAMAATGREFIVVVPDHYTKHGGSMYSDSVTVGNFETFTVKELVAHIDGSYRTLAKRESRGLSGHSMGGYGTMRLGIKHPELFSSIYAMNPCCLRPRSISGQEGREYERLTPDQVAKADFGTRANYAVAATWSPNPNKPPFYADLATKDGKIDDLVMGKWAANAPVALVPQYLPGIRSLTAIGMDTGDKDFVRDDVEAMHAELLKFGVKHDWELYEGDHGNRVSERLERIVFPFFARHLKFEAK